MSHRARSRESYSFIALTALLDNSKREPSDQQERREQLEKSDTVRRPRRVASHFGSKEVPVSTYAVSFSAEAVIDLGDASARTHETPVDLPARMSPQMLAIVDPFASAPTQPLGMTLLHDISSNRSSA